MNRPVNLIVDTEPDYDVFIVWNDPAREPEYYGRWKRVTAISRARYVAIYHPTATVRVQIVVE